MQERGSVRERVEVAKREYGMGERESRWWETEWERKSEREEDGSACV